MWQLPNHQLERVQALPVDDQTVACRCSMFENFAVLITPSINRVVEFAKRIPGNETGLYYVVVKESVTVNVHMFILVAIYTHNFLCCFKATAAIFILHCLLVVAAESSKLS